MPSDSGACLLRCALFDLVDHVRPLCAGQNGCNVARQEHHATTFYILQPEEARKLATWPATSRKVVAHFKQKYDGIAPRQAREYGGVGGFGALLTDAKRVWPDWSKLGGAALPDLLQNDDMINAEVHISPLQDAESDPSWHWQLLARHAGDATKCTEILRIMICFDNVNDMSKKNLKNISGT